MKNSQFIRMTLILILLTVPVLSRAEAYDPERLVSGEDEPFDPEGTLDEYIIHALRNNPGLKSAYYAWRSELEKADAAGYLPDPVLSFGYFIESIETRVGPQRYRLGIRQSIPWFGKLSTRKEGELRGASASFKSFLSERARIVLRVRTSWLEYYRIGRMKEIVSDDLSLLKGYEAVALAGYRSGSVPQLDLIRVQVEMAALEERLRSLGDRLDTAGFQLLEALGLPDSITLPVPSSIPDLPEEPEWNELKDAVLLNNPDISALDDLIERGVAMERLAGKGYFPDITIGIDYIETGDAIDPLMEGSGKDPWGVNISLTVPLWFGRTAAARRSAAAGVRMYRYRKEAKMNEIVASAREILNSLKESRRKATLYGDGIVPRGEQLLRTAYSAYMGGTADFIDVISSQRQLLDYRMTLLESEVTSAKMAARLEYLAGFQGLKENATGKGAGRKKG